MNKLYNAPCLEILKTFPDKSYDIVVTSPPYNMNLRIRKGKHCSRQIVKELSTKYKNFSDNLPMEEYYEFNVNVITELLRVSKLVFYNVMFLTGNKSALFKLLGTFHKEIKEIIIWDKVTAEPAISQGVMNSQFEVILVMSSDPSDSISRQFKNCSFPRGTLSNLWSIKRGKKVSTEHGATFPEELVEKILTNFTKAGDHVLDPFMGTGTTGKVCNDLKRNFTGIEIDKDYFEFANKRIENTND